MARRLPAPVIIRDATQMMTVLQYLRVDQDLTTTQVAGRVGVKQQSVSEWLRGKHEPTAGNLIGLVQALNCDLVLVPRR